jgi:sugar phosphate isomerase/epimerase
VKWAISTRWNVRRHSDGRGLVDEILHAGFNAIELSYDFRRELIDGVAARVQAGDISVVSVHAYCPVPRNVPRGHPELWLLTDPDETIRRRAVQELTETVRFAASMGAPTVVVHAGYVRTRWARTGHLIRLAERGVVDGLWWRWKWSALFRARERGAPAVLDRLRQSLEQLMPVLEECQVSLGFENLPSWEAVPSEMELRELCAEWKNAHIGYWHDFGHGQIRENLGFIGHLGLLRRMSDHVRGFHVHDVRPPAQDHVLPPHGSIPFREFAEFATLPVPFVIEATRDASVADLRAAVQHLEAEWGIGSERFIPTATRDG